MIKKISIKNVRSYKEEATLETDKKINFIYGLNGSGKTTISDYLEGLEGLEKNEFRDCSLDGFNREEDKILVYNQNFVENNFYELEEQKGIFTLAKENKDALEKIKRAEGKINNIKEDRKKLESDRDKKSENREENLKKAEGGTWKIKEQYENRIFDKNNFLHPYKGSKSALFEHLKKVELDKTNKTNKTIEKIGKELEGLGKDVQSREPLVDISDSILNEVEENKIFKKVIIGKEDSTVSSLIKKLGNSDWVNRGLDYISKDTLEESQECPFCQEQTLTKTLVQNLNSYFDESYANDISTLKSLKDKYQNIEVPSELSKKFFTKEQGQEIENLFSKLDFIYKNNIVKIKTKIEKPSQSVNLESSEKILEEINLFIKERNDEIKTHNTNLKDRQNVIRRLKTEFWGILRKEYDDLIKDYHTEDKKLESRLTEINKDIGTKKEEIGGQMSILKDNNKNVTNIDETINYINADLSRFGILDVEIKKIKKSEKKDTYRLIRTNDSKPIFNSLSEGEKTVISFLYFIRLCAGSETEEDTKKKIIVIDDPVSSLSHMYVFNIADSIKRVIIDKIKENQFLQCFILTHSLYFFNELCQRYKHNNKVQLFRIIKSESGSIIKPIKKDEIENEYESYWSIIKSSGEKDHVCIANAMRNILEYFTRFIASSTNLYNFLNDLEDQEFIPFYRYMNSESHSDGPCDWKELDIKSFKRSFEKCFEEMCHIEHYNKMMGN